MTSPDRPPVFLLVEDSEHDVVAFRRAWRDNGITSDLRVVGDGRQCIDYLRRQGAYRRPEDAPRPRVVLLNNRMPQLDGMTVLDIIRSDRGLAHLPVVFLTASESERLEARSYDHGVNAYLRKPLHYEDFSRVVARLHDFWELVELPETPR